MPTLQNIIDRIEDLAVNVAADANVSPLIDTEVTAFTLFPHLVKFLVQKRLADGKGIEDVMAEHAIEIGPGGYGTLPDSVLREATKHSHLPDYRLAAWVAYPSYVRHKLFSSQFPYYSNKDARLYFSESPLLILYSGLVLFASTENSLDVQFDRSEGTALANAMVDHQITVLDDDGNYVLDAFVDSVDLTGLNDELTATAGALSTQGSGTAIVYDASRYVDVRRLSEVGFNADDNVATNVDADFSDADVGRRFSCPGYVDAIIDEVVDSDTCILRGKVFNPTDVPGPTADIMQSPLTLRTPTMPGLPTDLSTNLELSPDMVKDVIALGAAVLRGEMPLSQIIHG